MDEYLAIIKMFGGNFAPRGTAFCNGQLVSISQNSALFALLGTTFGGDGQTTFGLPDLRGRTPVHSGNSQGPGLSAYVLGQRAGTESITLTTNNLAAHTHPLTLTGASTSAGTSGNPEGKYSAQTGTENDYSTSSNGSMTAYQQNVTITNTGGNQSFSILQPYLVVNFVIFLEGVFPSRN